MKASLLGASCFVYFGVVGVEDFREVMVDSCGCSSYDADLS